MAQLISSKIVVFEEAPSLRTFPVIPTAVAAMQGVTEKGPVATATRHTSFDDWSDVYGGFIAASKTALIVEAYFNNGGRELWFSRVVHFNSILDTNTKTSVAAGITLSTPARAATAGTILSSRQAPFGFSPGDTLIVDVDGGGDLTATFDAAPAVLTSVGTEPHALANGETLIFKIDGGVSQTVTFLTADFAAIGAATSAEVAFVINRDSFGVTASVVGGSVVLTSDRQGTSSEVEVTGGTANVALAFSVVAVFGTGDVAFIDSVTIAEIKTVVEADIAGLTVTDVSGRVRIDSNTTGVASSIQVSAVSTTDFLIGFDNVLHSGTNAGTFATLQVDGKYDGGYANVLRSAINSPSSGVVSEFNFSVVRNGVAVEVFPNVTMDDTLPNYIETVVNGNGGSVLVKVTDLDAATTPGFQAPNTGQFLLTGGVDGLVGLADIDYIGSQAGQTGFFAFDQVQEIRILAVPDRPTAPVQNAAIDYAEVTRNGSMFVVVTLPDGQNTTQAVDFVVNTANIKGKSEYSAVYHPGFNVVNPAPAIFGATDTVEVPNTGHVMGIYARTDGARDGGVYDEPAGTELGVVNGIVSLANNEVLDERKRDFIVGAHINPIATRPGLPFFIDDSISLKRDGNFPTVAQRRGVIFIEISIQDGLEPFRLRPNDEQLRDEVERSIEAFLLIQFKNRAFRGTTPDTSYFVDASEEINTPVVIQAEQLIVRIGLATQRPARFLVLRFSQDLRDVEAELAAS